jgi:uncharacterized protein YxeA
MPAKNGLVVFSKTILMFEIERGQRTCRREEGKSTISTLFQSLSIQQQQQQRQQQQKGNSTKTSSADGSNLRNHFHMKINLRAHHYVELFENKFCTLKLMLSLFINTSARNLCVCMMLVVASLARGAKWQWG